MFHAEHWRVGTISAAKKLHRSSVPRVLGMVRARPSVRVQRTSRWLWWGATSTPTLWPTDAGTFGRGMAAQAVKRGQQATERRLHGDQVKRRGGGAHPRGLLTPHAASANTAILTAWQHAGQNPLPRGQQGACGPAPQPPTGSARSAGSRMPQFRGQAFARRVQTGPHGALGNPQHLRNLSVPTFLSRAPSQGFRRPCTEPAWAPSNSTHASTAMSLLKGVR